MKMILYPWAPLWDFVKICRQSGGIEFRKIFQLIPWIIRYTFLEPFRIYETIIYQKKIQSHVLAHPPIFILGHWRSGTSFLQQLLYTDPNINTCTIFRCIFPECFFTLEKWLKPILNFITKQLKLVYHIQRIPLDWDLPAEEEIGLLHSSSSSSYSWGHVFPKSYIQWLDKSILLKTSDTLIKDRWKITYDFFIKKLSLTSPHSRILLKSPGNTARIPEILALYPEAKFIYIYRDPEDVFHSTIGLWKLMQKQSSLQVLSEHEIESYVLLTYKAILQQYAKTKELIPSLNLVEIAYEELRESPIHSLYDMYEKLELGAFSPQHVESFLKKAGNYQPNIYSTCPIIKQKLKVSWPFAFERS